MLLLTLWSCEIVTFIFDASIRSWFQNQIVNWSARSEKRSISKIWWYFHQHGFISFLIANKKLKNKKIIFRHYLCFPWVFLAFFSIRLSNSALFPPAFRSWAHSFRQCWSSLSSPGSKSSQSMGSSGSSAISSAIRSTIVVSKSRHVLSESEKEKHASHIRTFLMT